jgi:AMMECR1 domain-containing protein
MIPADSMQQASDLADEILKAATNLVSAVEAHATIRPGVTERTLQDLQVMIDVLEETTKDIKDEPIVGYPQDMDIGKDGVGGDGG